ncbi:H-NS histone family protein [Pseudoduganella umbonata]|uniref:DNA-binding protein H-NS n=1 Tax=Pseudoduganella umbonata TaxID=864828 RepID=A0A4P8HPW4_9BURK|nr:H-NS histone family protein [Pseudoduganella umbonata]MBB3220734.1 DNA-binding protein H-NS [Pseudoduganella umbonata]QCP11787.1 H-NS histone family protein [Pseudoduganella umbonata]
MDLSNLSASELRNLQEQVKRELKKRETHDLQKAKDEIFAIAQRVGLPLKDLIASNPRGKGGTVAARFRNPSDGAQQWTGRGRQPKWVKDWVDAGKSIDDLRI